MHSAWGLVALFYACPVWATLTVVPGAPADFQALEAPRVTMVTVEYGGESLGSYRATYTPTTLTFSDPAAIIAAIPTINDQAAIAAALASPLPTHADLLCGSKPRQGCGTLGNKTTGIIFDENKLTAELFLPRDKLAVTEQNSARYLPLPERAFSSVYRFDGAVNGTEETTPTFALSNTAIYSFGEGNLETATSVSNQGLRFDTVSADVERNGWSASGGLIRSIPLQLASDRDIAGVSLSTSMRTRLDARKTEGNELLLFLPRQAFVSIYREGRLYSSHSYDAGNQRLDTSELPDGAYTVTLKIQEPDGATREETRFFAKSEQIPPPDAPTYYMQAGVMRAQAGEDSTVPQLSSDPILRTGTVRRVDDNIGLGVGLLGLSDRAAVETSAFMVSDDTQLRATAFGSSAGDAGLQANLIYVKPKWNTAIDARQLWAGKALPTGYDNIISNFTQLSASVNYLYTPAVTFSATANYSAGSGAASTTSIGPAVNWQLWQAGESMLYFTADAAHMSGHNEGSAILRFSYRMGDYGVSGEVGNASGGSAPGPFGTARVWHDSVTPDDTLLAGATMHDDGRNRSLGADADWRNRFSSVRGSVQQAFGPQSGTNYGGNFSVGAAQAQDMVHLGGNNADMSAVMVEADGTADTSMTIFVNNIPRGTITVGERHVIYLAPYNIYRIHLGTAKGGLYNIEGGDRKVTLYPGNVARLVWHVDPFTVVTGRVVGKDGKPLIHAALQESKVNVATDGRGRFQAELTHPGLLHFVPEHGALCSVRLPQDVPVVNGVQLYRTPLLCE